MHWDQWDHWGTYHSSSSMQKEPSPKYPLAQWHWNPPEKLVHSAFSPHFASPLEHSSISIHPIPVNSYPSLQAQRNPLGISKQSSFSVQVSVPNSHSFSAATIPKSTIKTLFMINYDQWAPCHELIYDGRTRRVNHLWPGINNTQRGERLNISYVL